MSDNLTQLSQLGHHPFSQMPVASAKWRHYPTTVYEKNYGFGINYYQPMIDYLDRKENGEVSKDVALKAALPMSEARGTWEHKYVVPYTRDQLVKHAVTAEMKAKEHLDNFKVDRSVFFFFKLSSIEKIWKWIKKT